MALTPDIYVDDSAIGANDGTSWTDAYTSFGSAVSNAAAGNIIGVAYTHNESVSSNVTYNFSNATLLNPIKVVSLDPADNTPTVGAKLSSVDIQDIELQGKHVYHWGMSYLPSDELFIGNSGTSGFDDRMLFEKCTLGIENPRSPNPRISYMECTLLDCTLDWSVADGLILGENIYLVMIGGTFKPFSTTSPLWGAIDGDEGRRVLFEGVNITTETSSIVKAAGSGAGPTELTFRRCNIPNLAAMSALIDGTPGGWEKVSLENCADGEITSPPLGLTRYQDAFGAIATDLSRYRSSGADDGAQANPYSWEMAGSANASSYAPLRGPKIARWVAGGSQITVTLHVAAGSTITDQEFQCILLGPDSASVTTAQADLQTNRPDPGDTAASLASDSASTWNGSGVGTKHKVSFTYTPAVSGVLTIQPMVVSNKTIYVDPKIEVA